MTIQELARQAVEHIKTANGRLHCSDVSDAYLTHLEKQGADHGVCEHFLQLFNTELKKEGLTPLFQKICYTQSFRKVF